MIRLVMNFSDILVTSGSDPVCSPAPCHQTTTTPHRMAQLSKYAMGVQQFLVFRNVELLHTFPEKFGFVSTEIDNSDIQIDFYDTNYRILSDPNPQIMTLDNED